MTVTELDADLINRAAHFLPMDPADEGTLPCVEIGGVQVYTYVDEDDGVLVVSLHFDTAEPPLLLDGADAVPVRVIMGGATVFEER